VVADCYNANPDSFRAAVDYLRRAFAGRRRAAVVGTMLELGEHSSREHRRVARWLLSAGFDVVAATGEFVDALEAEDTGANGGPDVVVAGELDALWEALKARLEGDEVVLVKASRGAGLDVIVERLEAAYGSSSSGGSRPGGPPHHPGGGGREGTRPPGRDTSTTPTPGGRS
jgi:UDP-N-acetylmuramoyl-tripeptide--D-alanyl-D-alanine ligase